jgi:hypothetical protein
MIRIVWTGIVLVHALVTGPLLVQCVTPDGQWLIELLGHDPCHLHSGVAQTGMGSGTAVDPCADLLISNPAVMQHEIQGPKPQPNGVVFNVECMSREIAFDRASPVWKLPCGVKPAPSLSQSLRI